jgi:hypothetical protein
MIEVANLSEMESPKEKYSRWSSVPAHLKTKTQLKQMGLKPLDESNFQTKVKALCIA